MAHHALTEQKDQGWIWLSKDQSLTKSSLYSPGWSETSVVELYLELVTLLTLLPNTRIASTPH